MKVLKFGGTSVGSARRMKIVAKQICNNERKIVVLSAMAGTTNTLVEICDYLHKRNADGARETIASLECLYWSVIDELYDSDSYRQTARTAIKENFAQIRECIKELFTTFDEKIILAQGELISTAMMNLYLQEQGINSILLPALDYMRINRHNEPDMGYIRKHLKQLLETNNNADIYITQGYICRNAYDEIDNLQRGGSDYSASLIGAAIGADEIQIWTDIDGMHNNDPRYVKHTRPVRYLHFEEAAELGYFGAKILHPTCIQPAKQNNIPVRLLNTMDPQAQGTYISNYVGNPKEQAIKAVAAKDNITAIKIKSGRKLLAHGFLRKVFEIFETYHTTIDMVTTSEVGVSVTIDNQRHLPEILDSLRRYGTVMVDENMVIICIVGNLEWHNVGYVSQALMALKEIPVRMVSYGGSNYNISFLVHQDDKIAALQALNRVIFGIDD